MKPILFSICNFLPFHANGLIFTAKTDTETFSETYYSIGGGFVSKEGEEDKTDEITKTFPFPIEKADELLAFCKAENKSISEIVYENEKTLRSEEEIHNELMRIWDTMLECMYIGCHSEGILPGGLNVRRRAYDMHKNLIGVLPYDNPYSWFKILDKPKLNSDKF